MITTAQSAADGIVRLDDLYSFVSQHARAETRFEAYARNNKLGREYSRMCARLTATIPDAAGVYLWGRYEKNLYWQNIYFGMAGSDKSLRKRILEELKDERVFVWHHFLRKDDIQALRKNRLSELGHTGDPSYRASERALLKVHSTCIIWATLKEVDVRGIETDMIEALNPAANISRPAPTRILQKEAGKVFECFRSVIHRERPECASTLDQQIDDRKEGLRSSARA